jgi:hypothetical protein
MIEGTPIPMPDGTWAARVISVEDVKPGDDVQMITRTGKTWTVTVTEVLDGFQGIFLCKVRR